MKKIILLLAIGASLTTQTLFAQVPSYVPTNGLVGYWPFNGNANDESGNGNNGTVNGATLTTDRFGNSDRAYSFDGINDLISIPDSNTLSITNNITMSAWVYVNSDNQNYHSILSKRLNGNWSYNLSLSYYFGPGGSPTEVNKVFSGRRNNSGAQLEYKFSDEPIVFGQWFQITIKIENNVITFYKNGIDMGVNLYGNQFTIPMINQAIGLTIGSNGDGGEWFNGKLDDIGIWNRALTQQEITNLYNSSLPQTACLPANVPTSGLVGYWPFCGNANDESGNGNNGTNNGATLTADRFGNSNSAYSFDGVNDFISTNFMPPNSNQSRTISLWFNADDASMPNDGYSIVSYGADSDNCSQAGGRFELGMFYNTSASAKCLKLDGVCTATYSETAYGSGWHNFTVTYDNSFGNFISNSKIFIDGVLITTSNFNASTIINTLNLTNFTIGKSPSSPTQRFFKGSIDDIGVWNRALTQQEITNLYNVNQCITNITVTDTLIINVGQLSFNDPVAWANNITIAPNPASTQININFNNITNLNGGTLKIINSLGQEVATTPITTSGTNSTMQLATWGGTGMYFVQIINPQGQIIDIKKIILQ